MASDLYLRAHYLPGLDWLYEPGPISRQQTTDSDTGGRDPRAIRNELSERNRTGAFAEVTQPAIQGPYLQGEERGLFTIGVAGCDQRRVYRSFVRRGRQLHCARRSNGMRDEE